MSWQFFWSWILKDCIKVQKKKRKVVVVVVEIRHFHVVVVQRRQRSAQKSVVHVQSCCFSNLNLLGYCRSRWRPCCRCCDVAASYPDISLLMKMCAQRKAGRRQRARRRFACFLYPSHGPLRFITSHSRFALASAMRKTKRLRRRLVTLDHARALLSIEKISFS